jgi:hypothetical protein
LHFRLFYEKICALQFQPGACCTRGGLCCLNTLIMENLEKEPAANEVAANGNGIHAPGKMKKWKNMRGENAWTMFKVMAEFVEGFEVLNRVGPCISIFGSARTKPGTFYYELATKVASRLSEEGYGNHHRRRPRRDGSRQQGCLDEKRHLGGPEH